jgi:myosin heavy subunit
MLIRISLIVAILAGIAVGVLNFVQVKEKIVTLQTNLKTQTDRAVKAENDYRTTKKELDKTKTELAQTQATLKATTEEKEKALVDAAEQKKRADKLTDDLTRTRGERDDAQRELAAYKATGLTPQEIVGANKKIKGLEDNLSASETENKILSQKIKNLNNELAQYKPNPQPVQLPAKLEGKVLVSDPKWAFVVLNVGEDQGILERGELLVNRDGKLVAKVKVSSVQKNRSVANVLPGWQLGEILEGDQVIPAYPAS